MAQELQQMFQGIIDLPKCSICLENLDEKLSSISCGHVFHSTCIEQSIRNKSVCPLCRSKTFQNQVRPLVYQIQSNNQQKKDIALQFENMEKSEQSSVLDQLRENSKLLQQSQDLKNQIAEYKDQNKVFKEQQSNYQKVNEQLQQIQQENKKLDKYNNNLKEKNDFISNELKDKNEEIGNIQVINDELVQENQKNRKFKQVYVQLQGSQDVEHICNIKKNENMQPIEKINRFYEYILIMNGNFKQYKQQIDANKFKLEKKNEQIEQMDKSLKQNQKYQTENQSLKQLIETLQKQKEKLQSQIDQKNINTHDDIILNELDVSFRQIQDHNKQEKKFIDKNSLLFNKENSNSLFSRFNDNDNIEIVPAEINIQKMIKNKSILNNDRAIKQMQTIQDQTKKMNKISLTKQRVKPNSQSQNLNSFFSKK